MAHAGGARQGSGRKHLSREEPTVRTCLCLTGSQRERLQSLGGASWVRRQIESAFSPTESPSESPFSSPSPLPGGLLPVMARTRLLTPFQGSRVQAGFPSPAESYREEPIDFNELLVSCPPATFVVRATGESMIDAGIAEGDLLVVDRSRISRPGDIVIMRINTEFTVKRLMRDASGVWLHPENASGEFDDIRPAEGDEWEVFGVVSFVIKPF